MERFHVTLPVMVWYGESTVTRDEVFMIWAKDKRAAMTTAKAHATAKYTNEGLSPSV